MNQMGPKKVANPEEVERRKTADHLDEADFWKLRLLNRNVDYFTSQVELAQLQLMESSRSLMAYSNDLATRYDFSDHRQVDVNTGKIIRDPDILAKLAGAPGDSDG